MVLNNLGEIARKEWLNTENIRDNVKLDVFVIMPNHVHAIFRITHSDVGANRHSPLQQRHRIMDQNDKVTSSFKSPSKTVGAIVRGYKGAVTTKINRLHQTPGQKVWQRNYYEHIIRNEESLNRIRNYIVKNPEKWDVDLNNPANRK